jgi:D-hexose-6-phosphate mutarotase
VSTVFEDIEVVRGGCGVSLETSPLGGPILRLTADGGVAEVALQGGQVMSWQPRGHAPVIWMSPMERLAHPSARPKAVRGGTPVCWPWFGPHPTDAGKPAHGFVRTRLWQVEGTQRADDRVRVRLSTTTTDADKMLWPHTARAELTVTLGEELGIELSTRNIGTDPFMMTQALHTYFAIGDIADISVEGFDGQSYIDKVDGNARKRQSGPIAFTAEVDRIYDEHRAEAVIVDPGLKRRLVITKSGSRSSVVWNPWSGKAVRLGDMGPDGWRRMVCVETCNAGDDIVKIAPGESHCIGAAYRVSAD